MIFLWLYHSLLIHLPTEGLGGFQVLAAVNEPAVHFCVHILGVDRRFLLIWVSREELIAGSMVRVFSFCKETARLFGVTVPFCMPTSSDESSCCSTSLLAFGCYLSWILSMLGGV